jgi:hypothetical protein
MRIERRLDAAGHRGDGRFVEDQLDAADGALDHGGVGNVALDEFDVVLHAVQVGQLAGRKVIEHAHSIAPLRERMNEVRADEARSTGDQNGSHGTSAVGLPT